MSDNEKSNAHEFTQEESDDYANRLVEECYNKGYITEDELTEDGDFKGDYDLEEKYAECVVQEAEKFYNSFAEWIEDNHGEEFLNGLLKYNTSLIDTEGIASQIETYDGYGYNLAYWDGVTNETTDFYAFKQSESDERTQEFLNELENSDLEY